VLNISLVVKFISLPASDIFKDVVSIIGNPVVQKHASFLGAFRVKEGHDKMASAQNIRLSQEDQPGEQAEYQYQDVFRIVGL